MIEVEIPNDIKEFEPKLIGPFTKRLVLCLVGMAIISFGGYFILDKFFDNGIRVLVPLIFDLPLILLAAYKPYGMKFEQYVMSQLYTTIIPPKHRKYKTENLYEQFEQQIEAEEAAKNGQPVNNKKKKKGVKR